jgi:carbon storage regulator
MWNLLESTMLVLTRKKDESIMIGDNIKIMVVDIRSDRVRIGIEAPPSVKVFRKEIYGIVTDRDADEQK